MAKAIPKLTDDELEARLLHLRDRTITLIRSNGQWQRIDATPVMTVKNHGNLSIVYLTPFQRAHPTGRGEPLGYAMEVSVGRRVVLSLMWDMAGPLFCDIYRPGAWEARLEAPAVTASLAA
jgi:hypothetical protein